MNQMTKYEQLLNNLDTLKFKINHELINEVLTDIDNTNISIIEGLLKITELEKEERRKSRDIINIRVASFPFIKTLDDFDFNYQPTINESLIRNLAAGSFIYNKENIIFYGNSGTGKTHLATALGIASIKNNFSTYFIKASKLFENLVKAKEQNRLEDRLKQYCKYQVLIIDELGYLPINKEDSTLFFQLIDRRYETKSTIITTNISFNNWQSIFQDSKTTAAIVDRLLHHSKIITIAGKSYRLKDILSEEQKQ